MFLEQNRWLYYMPDITPLMKVSSVCLRMSVGQRLQAALGCKELADKYRAQQCFSRVLNEFVQLSPETRLWFLHGLSIDKTNLNLKLQFILIVTVTFQIDCTGLHSHNNKKCLLSNYLWVVLCLTVCVRGFFLFCFVFQNTCICWISQGFPMLYDKDLH